MTQGIVVEVWCRTSDGCRLERRGLRPLSELPAVGAVVDVDGAPYVVEAAGPSDPESTVDTQLAMRPATEEEAVENRTVKALQVLKRAFADEHYDDRACQSALKDIKAYTRHRHQQLRTARAMVQCNPGRALRMLRHGRR